MRSWVPATGPFRYHNATNRNGALLVEFTTEHDLLVANTQFKKRRGKEWTIRDKGPGAHRQLDYILTRRKWRNSVLHAESYNLFNKVKSDHRVISMKVRLSLSVLKQNKQTRYDCKVFSTRPDLQQLYTASICWRRMKIRQ